MTRVAQIRQVVRPLLERNSDLALVGRLIVVKPVRHLLLGVYIGRSLDPLLHVPTWSVLLLSDVQKRFGFLWGERVRRQGGWQSTDPGVSSAMCEAIEQEALAPMRSIKTFDDFIDLTSKLRNPRRHLDLFPIARLTVDIARGDLVAAEAICKYLKTKEGKAEYFYMQERYERAVQELCPLVAVNDRAGLANLLHSYEAQTVKNLKLEKYWERTPFPIELESGTSSKAAQQTS
jgi:hypothetical protein